jgi:lysyl-tRNA synthetase class 2
MREDLRKRLSLVGQLKIDGVNPYPYSWRVTHSIKQITEDNQERIICSNAVSIAGRVTAIRYHGKSTFLDLSDEGQKIQCYFKIDELGEANYSFLKRFIERGDIIDVTGNLFYTKCGELTLRVKDFTILCKALYDFPGTWYGLQDPETRYRFRHLDLMLNPKVREIFILKSKIIREIRTFLDSRSFIEVETPVIQEVYGGANARPFLTHVHDLGEERFLRISPELYLKRLIIGGLNKVYEIGKNFRNESITTKHHPEFLMMEIYQAYADYTDMMQLTEELVGAVAQNVLGTLKVNYSGSTIDFTPPYKRLTMYEAIKEYGNIDVTKMDDQEIESLLSEKLPGGYDRGSAVEKLFESNCEHELTQPTFIVDHPKGTTYLCKQHRENNELLERFELYVAGMEIANAYTELNDPLIQRELLLEEAKRRRNDDPANLEYDADFIDALCYGMPPTGGLGIGIDRLVMVLTGSTSIKEVIPFPLLRKADKSNSWLEPEELCAETNNKHWQRLLNKKR